MFSYPSGVATPGDTGSAARWFGNAFNSCFTSGFVFGTQATRKRRLLRADRRERSGRGQTNGERERRSQRPTRNSGWISKYPHILTPLSRLNRLLPALSSFLAQQRRAQAPIFPIRDKFVFNATWRRSIFNVLFVICKFYYFCKYFFLARGAQILRRLSLARGRVEGASSQASQTNAQLQL